MDRSSSALKGRLSAPWGQRGLSAGPRANSPARPDPREGKHIPQLYSKLAKERHGHVGWRAWGGGGAGCHWNTEDLLWVNCPSISQGHTTIYPTSSLAKMIHKQWRIFPFEPCTLWTAVYLLLLGFSMMDNKLIQAFSPSKYMMKHKTGIPHYAMKKDKIQQDNNSGSDSNHISMYT